MYGWIHGCLKNMLAERFGDAVWDQIVERSGIEFSHTLTSCSLNDLFVTIAQSAAEIVGIESSQVLEMYGMYFAEYAEQQGHEGMLLCLGNDIVEWINNINQHHSYLIGSMPNIIMPDIWCDWESEDTFLLTYKSTRMAQLAPVLVGIVTVASKKYFSKTVSFERLATQGINKSACTQWRVVEVDANRHNFQGKMNVFDSANAPCVADRRNSCPEWVAKFVKGDSDATITGGTIESGCVSNPSTCMLSELTDTQPECSYCHYSPSSRNFHGLSFTQVHKLFPCHIVFDHHLQVLQVGERMRGYLPELHLHDRMDHHFAVATPNVSWLKKWVDFEAVSSARPEFEIVSLAPSSSEGKVISFSGPLSFAANGEWVMFLCVPNVSNLREMHDHKLSPSDMDAHGCRLQKVLQHDHLKSAQDMAHRMEVLTEEVRTEKEKTVQLMQEVTEKAQEAMATKKTFVRYVSHEIRTPLTVAKLGLLLVEEEVAAMTDEALVGDVQQGGSEVGHSSLSSRADVLDHIRDCGESLNVAVSILDDLLSYEKLESGIYDLFKDVCPVVSFVEKSLKLFGVQAKQKRVKFVFDCRIPADKRDAYCWDIDAKKMSQVMRNSLSNALNFTPPGGTVTVVVTFDPLVHDDENWDGKTLPEVVKSVTTGTEYELVGIISVGFYDTGVGIERSKQSKLFNEIGQFSPNELQAGGGSGLGLWISRGIVDLHHGRTHMHSEGLGQGSAFFVDVPTYIAVATSGEPAGSHRNGHFGTLNAPAGGHDVEYSICQGLKVLVVDDAIMVRKLISRVLKSRGCCCDVAEDGLAAVRAVEKRIMEQDSAFDVILMDFVMPVMDGPSAVLQIRALGFRGAIIGVTGNMLPADTDHFMQCGADTVLPKPLVLKDLVSYLDSFNYAKAAAE